MLCPPLPTLSLPTQPCPSMSAPSLPHPASHSVQRPRYPFPISSLPRAGPPFLPPTIYPCFTLPTCLAPPSSGHTIPPSFCLIVHLCVPASNFVFTQLCIFNFVINFLTVGLFHNTPLIIILAYFKHYRFFFSYVSLYLVLIYHVASPFVLLFRTPLFNIPPARPSFPLFLPNILPYFFSLLYFSS